MNKSSIPCSVWNRWRVLNCSSKTTEIHTKKKKCSECSPSRVIKSQRIRKSKEKTISLEEAKPIPGSTKDSKLPSPRKCPKLKKQKTNYLSLTWSSPSNP